MIWFLTELKNEMTNTLRNTSQNIVWKRKWIINSVVWMRYISCFIVKFNFMQKKAMFLRRICCQRRCVKTAILPVHDDNLAASTTNFYAIVWSSTFRHHESEHTSSSLQTRTLYLHTCKSNIWFFSENKLSFLRQNVCVYVFVSFFFVRSIKLLHFASFCAIQRSLTGPLLCLFSSFHFVSRCCYCDYCWCCCCNWSYHSFPIYSHVASTSASSRDEIKDSHQSRMHSHVCPTKNWYTNILCAAQTWNESKSVLFLLFSVVVVFFIFVLFFWLFIYRFYFVRVYLLTCALWLWVCRVCMVYAFVYFVVRARTRLHWNQKHTAFCDIVVGR